MINGTQLINTAHSKERMNFRSLILANPNHFGNLKNSNLKSAVKIVENTVYEEIGCVGFQPQFNLLEAVVFVKQPGGYSGGVCSKGSQEYVRFYTSFDNGSTWDDMGVTSFTAHDIPATKEVKRLEYAVTLPVDIPRKLCTITNQVLVRAILSWSVPPPPNDPTFAPVWGNVHNNHIEIDPLRHISLKDLVEEGIFSENIKEIVDLEQPLPTLEPKTLSAMQLQELYSNQNVSPHRFALKEINDYATQAEADVSSQAKEQSGLLSELDIDFTDIVADLFPKEGSTQYEQLECIGLQPSTGGLDTLVGTVRVKLPNGYSGNPCTAGSKEYVAFWGDFDNNGSFETYLGTTSVNVYDISKMPKDGLEYAVFLPVNLDKYRWDCKKGAKVVKIRAILSWQVMPPPNNPNYVPVWGNHEDTHIQITPGTIVQPDTHPPFIEVVGSMQVTKINSGTGLANGSSTLGFTAFDSPFGGLVRIDGHIANTLDISNGALPLKYKIMISGDNGLTWQNLTNSFSVGRTQLFNGSWSFLSDANQVVDGSDYYTYQEDLVGGPGDAQIFVSDNVLGYWQTAGLSGLWKIKIEAKDPANATYMSNSVSIYLDNEAPQFPLGTFKITSGAGDCGDFVIGDLIEGTYEVTDAHFGSLNLSVLPALGGSFTQPIPLPRTYPVVPTTGESGTWELDTTGMPRCGYVICLSASDRTIVNSGYIGFSNQAYIGLCLRVEA